jgi:hypothetical protein
VGGRDVYHCGPPETLEFSGVAEYLQIVSESLIVHTDVVAVEGQILAVALLIWQIETQNGVTRVQLTDQGTSFVGTDMIDGHRNGHTTALEQLRTFVEAKREKRHSRSLVPQTGPDNGNGIGEPDVVQSGETATWRISNPTSLGRYSTSIEVVVTRLGCSSGVTGETLAPVVTYKSEQNAIRIDVEPFGGGAADCQGNDAVPVTVQLDQPLGERTLIDGGCLRIDAADTAACTSDLRWQRDADPARRFNPGAIRPVTSDYRNSFGSQT